MPTSTVESAVVNLEAAARATRPDTAVLQQRYARNLTALYRSNPALAARIDALPFSACPALEPTRDGRFTVRLIADDGKAVYAHGRHQPQEETCRCVAALRRMEPPAAQAGEPGLDPASFSVAGLGLGYHVLELQRQFGRVRVLVSEDEPGLIKAALCATDLSAPLAAGLLVFLTAADKAHVHEMLRPIHADVLLGLRMLTLPHTTRCHAAFHADVRRLLTDFVAFARVQMVTLLRNARITCKNIAFNLPAYLAGPGVEGLAGRAAGYPAILVAAGPSLARNIDQLAGLRPRAVIIAVQTVFKTLLARGIPPHFVTSLDFHEISAQFFHGLDRVGDSILVAEPKASWHVLDTFRGRTYVLHHELYDDLLREAAPRRAGLRAGSTVAHLAFYLAEHLGCDPIILVGQDLAYSDGLYYPPGMPIEQIWRPELNRFCTVEMKQWERIVRARSMLRPVQDLQGRATYSDEQLLTYAEQFQGDFAASSARVIHACEGGLRLAGTEPMTLQAAGQRFCTRLLPERLFAAAAEPPPPGLAERARRALTARLEEIAQLRDIAGEMDALLEKLVGLLDRPAEFNRVVARVDDLRARIRTYDRTYKTVVDVSQLAELRRYSADRRLGDHEQETAETAQRRLRRDREFVAAFRDGCDYLLDMLAQARQRLDGGAS